MDQAALLFTGFIAIWLTQDESESRRKYACLFGLAGQPFLVLQCIHDRPMGNIRFVFRLHMDMD